MSVKVKTFLKKPKKQNNRVEESQNLKNLEQSVRAIANKMQEVSPTDLRNMIHVAGEWLEKALEDWRNEIEELHKIELGKTGSEDVKGVHYTSMDVVVSILENTRKGEKKINERNSLRLYDSSHLNDPDEGNYVIRDLAKEYNWLEEEAFHAYIASFIRPETEKDMSDNLMFWRTYGKEGMGCSLSLNIPQNQLKKVLYGPENVERFVKLLKPILKSINDLVKIQKEPVCSYIRENFKEKILESLGKFRYLYKSTAHDYENECRFVIVRSEVPDRSVCFEFHDRNKSPLPKRHYCIHEKLAAHKLLSTDSSITLGPCVTYPDSARYYLETLKRKAGLDGLEIRTSKISYRKS